MYPFEYSLHRIDGCDVIGIRNHLVSLCVQPVTDKPSLIPAGERQYFAYAGSRLYIFTTINHQPLISPMTQQALYLAVQWYCQVKHGALQVKVHLNDPRRKNQEAKPGRYAGPGEKQT